MELREIELLLDKYFDAETSIAEENQLKMYFSSSNVAPHLEQYRSMFGYFAQAGEQRFEKTIPLKTKKRYVGWLSVAASVVIAFGVFTFINKEPQEDLGTFDDPEIALRETQKALNMLSQNVNKGVNSINYLEEYENSRKTIFKK
ncbi:hypothetical protein FUA48_16925 [Flavobacterium alkalisoli]|uniref:DUF3379 domain-containing protein n=1 Tax=Flavobacterium alkalisoli TaxID=2602769 RepID=A0A5B9FVW6_9FLAO|nr:hypothetical protein [Flavobacterium alkalisoli]QEE51190.1 hypothetical protein FUA48_16925 [Flavobacterium alkalisoli]